MSDIVFAKSQTTQSQAVGNSPASGLLLQRKCACGNSTSSLTGECPECMSKTRLQTKLTKGLSNGKLDTGAGPAVDQLLTQPTNPDASDAVPKLQRFTTQQSAQRGNYPASVDRVLASPGRPLEPAIRHDMEQRFGHDFSHVRVHLDANAAESARAVNAQAYTVGHHMAFDVGRYYPQSATGGHLLAHELAHVVQQRSGPFAVHMRRSISEPGDAAEREADAAADLVMAGQLVPTLVQAAAPVSRFPYQTVGTTLNRANIATLSSNSYWVVRTADRYALTQSARMAADPEEQSAVLAALWASNPPATVTAHSERIVPVNPRPAPTVTPGSPAATAPPALLYRFKFDPPAVAGEKPQLECEFIATGPGAIPVAAPAPAADFTPGTLSADSTGFPGGRSDYFDAHPQEFAQLMNFLNGTAPLDNTITTETRNTRGAVTHTSLLHIVRVAATGGARASLDVNLIAEQAPLAAASAPDDYLARDASDFEIEQLQRTSIAAANRLGTVTLPAGLTPAEHFAVNLAISAYFSTGSRNTEVDAIVPVGATGTANVLFTLRFGAANAVTVERIGAVGTGTGAINMSRIDVSRIAGFPGATATDTELRAWWTRRYPGGGALQTPVPAPATTTGTAPASPNNTALLAEMNALITAGIASPAWFSGNYGIEVLGPSAATTRLQNAHHVPVPTDVTEASLADGTISFSNADLRLIELSLQTASTTVLGALRGVNLIRMTNAITRNSSGAWHTEPASTYGFTVRDGADRSTLLFDSFTHADTALFRGGSAATALPDSTMSVLHELGHAAGLQGGVETTFNAWRAAHPQAAQTWYATSAGGEVFPEAFALFQTDPHFLCGSAPLLFAWFREWTTTGTPPAASASLTAPTTCPP